MGPFPFDAPPARITTGNPMGTDGFEFVEFAHPHPQQLHDLFARMGFAPVARHRTRNITLYRQGGVNYLVNEEPGIYHGGEWVIDVRYPFIFDRRTLPEHHLGVRLHKLSQPPLPPEFANQHYPDGYVWSPPNFERFVDRCANEIRQRLGKPTMSRAEMLHALVGTPFEEFVARCREWVKKGSIPPFE